MEKCNILELGSTLAKMEDHIPQSLRDEVYSDMFSRLLESSLKSQYFLNRINEYTNSKYEIKLVNLRDNSQ